MIIIFLLCGAALFALGVILSIAGSVVGYTILAIYGVCFVATILLFVCGIVKF